MREKFRSLIVAVSLTVLLIRPMWVAGQQTTKSKDDADANPPVTQADVQIVQRAREILDSPSKWNRADTRSCLPHANTFSLYCALEKATYEVTGKFEHRGAAMQQARFVIDEIAPHKSYHHRLMDYNNDPATTFADIDMFFRKLQDRVAAQLKKQPQNSGR
jgi:hypothetical protein